MNSRCGVIIDKALIVCSILYVTLPVIIFFGGWLNHYLAIVLSLVFTFFACTLYEEFSPINIITKETAKFWLIVLACLALWVFMSGICGVVYQNVDLTARNAFYRDLCNYDWPVIYDNSLQNETVLKLLGGGYYIIHILFQLVALPSPPIKTIPVQRTN